MGPSGRAREKDLTRREKPPLANKSKKSKKSMQSVGIEPTLLRTRALSVRLNRSAKTAIPEFSLPESTLDFGVFTAGWRA